VKQVARIYSRKKGKHGSKKPSIKIVPRWVRYKKDDVENLVIKLSKEKQNSASIGAILRDQYGIPDVKVLAGKTVTKMMRENKLYPEMPEDMLSLLKKAVNLRSHLGKHKNDNTSKKGLEHLESKIRRLGKYYTREGILEKGWKYDPEKAKLIVQQK
jgi:small subunit ribosomal protein S15